MALVEREWTGSVRPDSATRAPGPRGRRLIGSLSRLRADPHDFFADAAAQYGDLVSFRAGPRNVFLAVGRQEIARVAIHNRDNYVKGVSYDALRVPIGDALLTTDGPVMDGRRKLLQPLFTRRRLMERVPAMAAAVDSLDARWERLARTGEVVNVVSEMNRLAFDVAGRVLVDSDLGDDMPGLEELIDEASGWVARRTRALVPLPPSLPTPRNRRFNRAQVEIRSWVERLIAARRARAQGDDDMVGRLVGQRGALDLDDVAVRDEVIGFLMAGHQTTGAGLSWVWYLLGHHPEAGDQLAAEAGAVLGARAPDAAALGRLVYTGQVLDETMRLYPPGWAFTRTPVQEDALGGYRVPAGSIVAISSYANQRNPRFWDRPAEFDPGRFAPGRPAPDACHYFPFGLGPGICIGKHLALMEMKLAVAMLARRWRVELSSPERVPADPGITLSPAAPIPARIAARRV